MIIKFELKKLFNKVTIIALILMCTLTALHGLVYLNLQWTTVKANGELVEGVVSFRALKEESNDIKGVINQEYLDKLNKNYEKSYDKKFLEENRGFMDVGGLTKYMFPNSLVNFVNKGVNMTNGNENMGLDFDYAKDEKKFYKEYKKTTFETIKTINEWNGLHKYSNNELNYIKEKVNNIKTPLKTGYDHGWSNFINYYGMDYLLVCIVLIFGLSGIFSKDSSNGIDEMALATKSGKKKNLNGRWIAGNLFIINSYLIFVATLLIVHGAVGGFEGWDNSVQCFGFYSTLNVNLLQGSILILFGGLLGVLVIGNIIMMFSIYSKNMKVTLLLGIIVIKLLNDLNGAYSGLTELSPLSFNGKFTFESIYYFIAGIPISYNVAMVILSAVYIGICYFLARLRFKKYYL